jgi:hypothetical protein
MTPTSTPPANCAARTRCANYKASLTPRQRIPNRCWGTQASDSLVTMEHLVDQAIATGAKAVDPEQLAEQVQLYRSAAQFEPTETAARSETLTKKHHARARRLLDRQDDYLRFTIDPRIPPNNNESERDIRMIKLRQRVSGCMRTRTGEPNDSVPSEATYPPRPNTATNSSAPSSCSQRDDLGCRRTPDQLLRE